MTAPLPCPDRDTLRALLDGGLAGEALEQVTHHVEGCPPCQQALETLVPESPSVCDLARQQDGQTVDPPSEVRRLVDQARAGLAGDLTATAADAPGADTPDELAFLGPPAQ